MAISESGAARQAALPSATAEEHMDMDGFTWHSISCVCSNCVSNDNKFTVTFNRPDFRPYG